MPEKTYPFTRGFMFVYPNGIPKCFAGIVASTRTKEEHDKLAQEIDDSSLLLKFLIENCESAAECQEVMDNYCRPIQDEKGYECYAVLSQYFNGWQYTDKQNIFKEGLHNE